MPIINIALSATLTATSATTSTATSLSNVRYKRALESLSSISVPVSFAPDLPTPTDPNARTESEFSTSSLRVVYRSLDPFIAAYDAAIHGGVSTPLEQAMAVIEYNFEQTFVINDTYVDIDGVTKNRSSLDHLAYDTITVDSKEYPDDDVTSTTTSVHGVRIDNTNSAPIQATCTLVDESTQYGFVPTALPASAGIDRSGVNELHIQIAPNTGTTDTDGATLLATGSERITGYRIAVASGTTPVGCKLGVYVLDDNALPLKLVAQAFLLNDAASNQWYTGEFDKAVLCEPGVRYALGVLAMQGESFQVSGTNANIAAGGMTKYEALAEDMLPIDVFVPTQQLAYSLAMALIVEPLK